MHVTWWMPGMVATLDLILVPVCGWFRARLAVGAGPDLVCHGLVHLLLEVRDQADRPRHHGQTSRDAPGELHLARDGRDGAGRVDGQVASVDAARLLGHDLHQ